MSLPGLTCNCGPESVRLPRSVSASARVKAEAARLAREAVENQRRLKREFYERQRRAA